MFYQRNSSMTFKSLGNENLPQIIFNLPAKAPWDSIKGIEIEGVKTQYFPLNILFSSLSLTVLFMNESETNYEMLAAIRFQIESKILLVYDKFVNFDHIDLILNTGFINLIVVTSSDFETTSQYLTFDVFPIIIPVEHNFTASIQSNPYKNHLSNVYEKKVRISCSHEIPNCMFTKTTKGGSVGDTARGLMLNILDDFARFINASLEINPDKSLKKFKPNITHVDILAYTYFKPPKGFLNNFLVFHRSSYPMDNLFVFIVVPSPGPLSTMFYPFKPFGWDIWLGTAAFIIYATVLLWVSSIEKRLELGQYFTWVMRLSFTQSVSYKENHAILSSSYMLINIFGFIMILWYGAILGSFLTKILLESPIETIDDIRSHGLKIAVPDIPFYRKMFTKLTDMDDIVQYQEYESFMDLLNNMDNRFAFAEDSNHWYHFILPQMEHYHDPKLQGLKSNLGSSFLRMIYKENSIYEERLNRVLFLLKDVGLYKHYTDMVFQDNIKFKYVQYPFKAPEETIHVLSPNYFKYVFLELGFGLASGFLVFLIEQLKFIYS